MGSLGHSLECSIFAGSLAGVASGGIVLYLYLLAPDVLLDHFGILNYILADTHLLLYNRALLHNDLFLADRDDNLILADLCLLSCALHGHPLDGDLFMPCGDLYVLAGGPYTLANPY